MPVDLDAVVTSNDRLTDTYNVVKLAAPEIAAVSQPGQFVMVKADRRAAPLLRRPFSIFERLRDDRGRITGLSLLNKRVGAVTEALYSLEPGERLRCLGPLGRPFSVRPLPGGPPAEAPAGVPTEAWMVAGGVGLAPFATLAEALLETGAPAVLFYGGRSARDLVCVDWFERLGVRVELATEDGGRGAPGLVTGLLERELAALSPGSAPMIYACGPTPMMRATSALARERRRPVEVALEPVMGCGLGGCYSCVVRLRSERNGTPGGLVRSCLHGPVFPGERIEWNALSPAV